MNKTNNPKNLNPCTSYQSLRKEAERLERELKQCEKEYNDALARERELEFSLDLVREFTTSLKAMYSAWIKRMGASLGQST